MLAISISDVVAVVDKLLELFEKRKKKSKKVFEDLIGPIFDQLLLVHADYLEMFENVSDDLQNPDIELSVIADNLRKQRLEFEPVRVKLRKLSSEYYDDRTSKGDPVDEFIKSVIVYFPSGELHEDPSSATTILTHLENLDLSNRITSPAHEEARLRLRTIVIDTMSAHRHFWAGVCESYAKVKIQYISQA